MNSVYKKLFLMLGVIALLYSTVKVAWSNEKLIPLNEYIAKQTDPRANQYVYTRCAGHFLYLAEIFRDTRDKQQKISEKLYGDSVIFTNLASLILWTKNKDKSLSNKYIEEKVYQFRDIYDKLSNENYLKRGEYISEFMKSDLITCNIQRKTIPKEYVDLLSKITGKDLK